MQKWEIRRIAEALDRLPAEERRAAKRALLRLGGDGLAGRGTVPRVRAVEAAGDIIRAAARGHGKRASDKETDRRRRVLVGARVPRERATRYQEAAAVQGLSLYAWVMAALERAAQDAEEQRDGTQDVVAEREPGTGR